MKSKIWLLFFLHSMSCWLCMGGDKPREGHESKQGSVRMVVVRAALCIAGATLCYVGIKRYLYSDTFESRWKLIGDMIKEVVEEAASEKKLK